ncbi:GDSL-type esterase/lipase family protein [Jiangella endophytica]|uniref:GDSL-type esterase/lipase family protein n=1 Tax=Jiangella endophytica TaxID=1623398 RepID=UPI0013004593|nr:GDSL-type esterase/lipase family protein [Jiangella endophytica]
MRSGHQGFDLDPSKRPEFWRGAVAWTIHGDRSQPWRLLPEEERYAYAEPLYDKARMAAGVRLSAVIHGGTLEIELETGEGPCAPVDILADGELLTRHPVAGPTNVIADLPRRRSEVDVWLPHHGTVTVAAAGVVGAAAVEPPPRAGTRWITYGSSITQCAASDGPSETWPALVARELGWDLTCMGFGGNCHLDPAAARTIESLDADVISLCLGINIYGRATYGARTLPGQIAELLRRVRLAHPTADIVVSSPIHSPRRETSPNPVQLTLRDIREMVHTVGGDLRAHGDTRLHVLDGLALIGEQDAHLLHDGLHPDADGYRQMAARTAHYLRLRGLAARDAHAATSVAAPEQRP